MGINKYVNEFIHGLYLEVDVCKKMYIPFSIAM